MEDKIIFLYLDHVSHFKGGVVLPGHHGGHTGYHDGVPRRIEWAPCGGILGGVYLQLAAERCSPAIHGQQLVLPRWWLAPVSSLGRAHSTRTTCLLVLVVSRFVSRQASAPKTVLCDTGETVTHCFPEQAQQSLCSPVLLRRE